MTCVAGLLIEHPIIPAAGMAKTPRDVRDLARSAAAMVVIGSYTPLARPVNQGVTTHCTPAGFLNSLGLPNEGAAWLRQELPAMAAAAHDAGKPLVCSVAAFGAPDYGMMAAIAREGGADMVELNCGCPNVWDDGTPHRIASFDVSFMGAILDAVRVEIGSAYPVAVKVSPFSDPLLLREVDAVIAASGIVRAVTAINTFPNAYTFGPDGHAALTPGGGLAGYSGAGLFPIALGQVVQHRTALPAGIAIIGVGGVTCGCDVAAMLAAGAVAVGVGQWYYRTGAGVFSTLLGAYLEGLST